MGGGIDHVLVLSWDLTFISLPARDPPVGTGGVIPLIKRPPPVEERRFAVRYWHIQALA